MASLTRRGSSILWGVIALCAAIELALFLSDQAIIGPNRLRKMVYDYGGFWPGLLDNWRPNYPAQPWIMFITYGFLHSGPSHLIVNMITLWSLGRGVLARVGAWGFAMLYLATLLGGAAGFALLAPGMRPMVGASGALFGLLGGLLAWAYVDRFTYNEGLWPIGRALLLLLALNLVLWWAMGGQLAWQTHLGGFITGWVVAMLIDPRAAEGG